MKLELDSVTNFGKKNSFSEDIVLFFFGNKFGLSRLSGVSGVSGVLGVSVDSKLNVYEIGT